MAGVLALAWLASGTILVSPSTVAAQEITATAAAQYNEATALISAGSYTEALAILDKVIALEPEFSRGYFDRGFVHEQMTNFVEAAADYGRAYELEPSNVDAAFGQGKTLYLGEDHASALAVLTPMCAQETPVAKACIYLARTQKKLGMMAEASATAAKATELEPENVDAHFELGAIEYERQKRSKQYDVAIQAYTTGLALAPDHSNAFAANFKLGKMQYRIKQYAEAEASFTAALVLRSTYAPAYIDLGNCRNKLKNSDGAMEAYATAIELKAPQPYGMAHYSMGRAYWEQDNAEAAITAYEAAIADPKFRHADKAREAITAIQDYLTKKKKAGGIY